MTDHPVNHPPPPVVFIPDDQQAGVWAHGVSASADFNEIILDFVLPVAHALVVDEHGTAVGVQPQFRVVSRVRLPPAQMFEMMKALSTQLEQWEAQFGQVPRPPGVTEEPLFPPGDPGDDGPGPTEGGTS